MKILIADDDRDLVDWLGYSFRRDGHSVLTAYNGEAALRVFQTGAPDIIVLDLAMPQRSGMDVLQEIRRHSQVPIILLTGIGDEGHVVQGLHSGADDYVMKPFRPLELKARAAAILRRSSQGVQARAQALNPLMCGEITLDPRTRQVTVSGRPVKLTPTEFQVLEYLMVNQGTVVRLSDILANVWGYDADQGEDVVRLGISRLRHKVEPDPAHPHYIFNVPGHGYVIRATP
jgi:DNA-binding response OmpR family regulator